ncbi:hypothetical protein SODALDRAFT_86783 [Sodiomyces alkalinus F11]|uniref:Uncharacterized protein n=1 Tax=Sodiomyces alkalinus (strain CBS 110278 / VKM F-3762 / F11) TaxID=1314773 RepID=A0A3N2PJ67_SODAK|nr:hypothetical protein SODALDRAFT_86783 [Sodiomyces alkalinus F11]ROT34480.1 hypothetical protein SODALDRAFT_86783 [Sodiomyces alkalinus F11]
MNRLRRPLCPNSQHLLFGERPLLCRAAATQAGFGGWHYNRGGRPNLRLISATAFVTTVLILSFDRPVEIITRMAELLANKTQPGSPEDLRWRLHRLEDKARTKHEYYEHALESKSRGILDGI